MWESYLLRMFCFFKDIPLSTHEKKCWRDFVLTNLPCYWKLDFCSGKKTGLKMYRVKKKRKNSATGFSLLKWSIEAVLRLRNFFSHGILLRRWKTLWAKREHKQHPLAANPMGVPRFFWRNKTSGICWNKNGDFAFLMLFFWFCQAVQSE